MSKKECECKNVESLLNSMYVEHQGVDYKVMVTMSICKDCGSESISPSTMKRAKYIADQLHRIEQARLVCLEKEISWGDLNEVV